MGREAGRVGAKNGLESYAYSLRNTLSDPKVDEKIEAADKETLKSEIDKTVTWLDDNQQAAKEEYEDFVVSSISTECRRSRMPLPYYFRRVLRQQPIPSLLI